MFPFQRLVRRFTFMGPPEPVEAPIVHVRQQLLGRYIKSEILENFLREIFEELSDDFEMEEVDSEYWAVRVPRLLTEDEIKEIQRRSTTRRRRSKSPTYRGLLSQGTFSSCSESVKTSSRPSSIISNCST